MRRWAARSLGPGFGVFEGPAVVGEVEVLDAELAAVVELLEPGEHGSGSRRRRSDRRRAPACGRACPGGAARDRRGRAARTDRRPSRRRDRCRRAAARREPRRGRHARSRRSARPRPPTARATRRAPRATTAPRAPTCRRRGAARAWRTNRAAVSGTRSGTRSAARATPHPFRASDRCARSRRTARARARSRTSPRRA